MYADVWQDLATKSTTGLSFSRCANSVANNSKAHFFDYAADTGDCMWAEHQPRTIRFWQADIPGTAKIVYVGNRYTSEGKFLVVAVLCNSFRTS